MAEQEEDMGRARVNNSHPNTRISSISTGFLLSARLGLGSAPARGPTAAHRAPGSGSPRIFSHQERCGLRQEKERKKYVEGSQGFKRHINKNPPTKQTKETLHGL